MTKIDPIRILPGQAGKIAREAAISMHTTPKLEEPINIAEFESKVCSVMDLTTEELGYFKYKGNVIKTVFPR